MIRRRLQDLTYCISYNVNYHKNKAHGSKAFRRQYTVLEELGRGGFGIVYKAERIEDGAPVAVKFIEHKRVREWIMKSKQLIPTEICLLEISRDIPGVVRLIDWFTNSKGFLIVMDRPEKCMDLFNLISVYGYLDEDVARLIFSQLLRTVCSLYNDYGIFHRDIKDENVIINLKTAEAILVDFGAAAFITEDCAKEFQGTRSYCPPEWFKRLVYMPLEATVWSLGIVLYVMVSGHLPFHNEIQICLGRLITPKHISDDCENLLRKCLTVIPERRIALLDIQNHKWFDESCEKLAEPLSDILERQKRERRAAIREKNDRKASAGHRLASGQNQKCTIPRRTASSQLIQPAELPASYDNVTINIRTEMFGRRDCYDIDHNSMASSSNHPISLAELPSQSIKFQLNQSISQQSPFDSLIELQSAIGVNPHLSTYNSCCFTSIQNNNFPYIEMVALNEKDEVLQNDNQANCNRPDSNPAGHRIKPMPKMIDLLQDQSSSSSSSSSRNRWSSSPQAVLQSRIITKCSSQSILISSTYQSVNHQITMSKSSDNGPEHQ